LKLQIKLLIVVALFAPQLTRAETYYEASNEVCYNEEETASLRAKLQDCQVTELDLHSVEAAYKTCQSRGGSCSYDWTAFAQGALIGGITIAIVTAIVKGGL